MPPSQSSSSPLQIVSLIPDGATWTQQAKLVVDLASSQSGARNFGVSVSIDGATAVVGDAATGEAFVYEKSGGSWELTSVLKPHFFSAYVDQGPPS